MSKKNRTRLKKFSAFMLVFSILIGSLINVSPLYAEEGNFNNQYDQKEIFDVPTESVESKDATEESVVTEKTEEDLSEGDVTLDKGAGDINDDQNDELIPDIDKSNNENGIIEDETIEDLPDEPVNEDLTEETAKQDNTDSVKPEKDATVENKVESSATDVVVNNFLANTDNPDHLTGPVYLPDGGRINYDIYPETQFGYQSNLSNRLQRAAKLNDSPVIGVDHPSEAGEVMLFKEAKPVEGKLNTWEVTLRVEGKDTVKKSDVVLVIDRSGSMNYYGRMQAAKNAAKAFVSKLLPSDIPSDTTRIAVVSFASDVRTDQGLTNNKNDLNNAIDNLSANGGTFTQAGVRQAKALLDKSDADYKHIVVLSDGEPTYSYQIPNDTTRRKGYVYISNERYYETGTNYIRDAYNDTRTGSGSSMYQFIESYNWRRGAYYNHGNSAIAEARIAGSKKYNVFTIGLQTNETGSGVLEKMKQGSGSFTEVQNVDELTPVFEKIAGQIASAARDASVSDPMGQGFTIPGNARDIKSIPQEPAAQYDPATKKITWNPGTLTTPIEPGSDIKYAQIKYSIEIDDDILDAENEGGKYDTNGDAQVTYTDANGNTQTVLFPKPKVDPVLWVVEKQIKDHEGKVIVTETGEFGIEVTNYEDGGTDPDGNYIIGDLIDNYEYKGTIKMANHSGRKLITNLRTEGYYKVEETSKVFGDAIDLDWKTLEVKDQYTFKFGEVGVPGQDGYIPADENFHPLSDNYADKQAFWVNNDDNGNASQDVSVRITNQLKPIDIVIKKNWDPKKPESVEEGIKFVITREIDGKVEDVKNVDFTEFKDDEYKLENLPRLDNDGNRYIYKVEEKLPENSDYESVASSENPSKKEDFAVDKEVKFEFTNIVKTIDIPVEKTWEDEENKYESRPDSITVQLYKDDKAIEGKTLELKPSENLDENWKGIFKEMPYKENGKEVKYSVKEVEVPTGYKEEITGDSLKGFTITNTLLYSQVQLKKTVSGNMYDSNSEYKFTYEIRKEGIEEAVQKGDITLKKDGVSDLIKVPVGYNLVFNENIDGFELKPTVTWQGGEENTTEYTWINDKPSEEPVEIEVNNDFTAEIPTGISDNKTPMMITLAMMLIGATSFIIYKKRQILED